MSTQYAKSTSPYDDMPSTITYIGGPGMLEDYRRNGLSGYDVKRASWMAAPTTDKAKLTALYRTGKLGYPVGWRAVFNSKAGMYGFPLVTRSNPTTGKLEIQIAPYVAAPSLVKQLAKGAAIIIGAPVAALYAGPAIAAAAKFAPKAIKSAASLTKSAIKPVASLAKNPLVSQAKAALMPTLLPGLDAQPGAFSVPPSALVPPTTSKPSSMLPLVALAGLAFFLTRKKR